MTELKAYCQLEGIELAWEDLMRYAQAREGDLDDLIAAHRTYLKRVTGRTLLLLNSGGEQVSCFTYKIRRDLDLLIFSLIPRNLSSKSFETPWA